MANRFLVSRLADASAAAGVAKTMLRLLAGANDPLTIIGWWVAGDSVASTDKPLRVEILKETAVAAPTGTTANPVGMAAAGEVGATSTAGLANASAEGAPTLVLLEAHLTPVNGEFYVQYPLGREIRIDGGLAIRMRVTSPTSIVNLTYGMMIEE